MALTQNKHPTSPIVSAKDIRINKKIASRADSQNDVSFCEAALFWYRFGFAVIPIIPSTKRPAVKWDGWLKGLSVEKISRYWKEKPQYQIGFIVSDEYIVFDADTPESVSALFKIEEAFSSPPLLSVKTKRGQHHYFRRASGSNAKSDAHSTEKYPERIDVKTGRSLIILPPSTGKTVVQCQAASASELYEADQTFIDAINKHNGRETPRPAMTKKSTKKVLRSSQVFNDPWLNVLLEHLEPDSGYENWLSVLMVIYHETGGSEEGFDLANAWSSRGSKYMGEQDVRTKWNSFHNYTGEPVTSSVIKRMLSKKGIDWIDVCAAGGPQFEQCEFKLIESEVPSRPTVKSKLFDRFSMKGMSEKLEADCQSEQFILPNIALLGQFTVLYARHNSGKTLLVIYLLTEVIRSEKIDASNIYYFNLDDSQSGLVEKLKIAEEWGFHVLCDGYRGFKVKEFITHIEKLCETDQARGVVLVLDTLKKFTDLMDKRKASLFGEVIRRFVLKGGTVIALAHVNKKVGSDGKPVYAGTTDIIDDADCAYVLDLISTDDATKTRVVEFENKKKRGNVASRVAYSYSIEDGLSYQELMATVCHVDEKNLSLAKQSEEVKADSEIIEAVAACISKGGFTKMRLRDAVSESIGISKLAAVRVIEKYEGKDPEKHWWTFTVKARGAKVYFLLEKVND